MPIIKKRELYTLISLLDDEDSVFQQVAKRLVTLGTNSPNTLKYLEASSNNASKLNALQRERLEEIIRKINYNTVLQAFKDWGVQSSPDLLEALLLIDQYIQQTVDGIWVNKIIKRIYDDIYCKLSIRQAALKSTSVFNQVFYDIYQFTTDHANDIIGFTFNKTLHRKKGDPTLISILYLILAQQLRLPIFPVRLSNHLIVLRTNNRHFSRYETHNFFNYKHIEFYIDPADKGAIFTKKEVREYFKDKYPCTNSRHLSGCSNVDVICLYLKKISRMYKHHNNTQRQSEIENIIRVLQLDA